MNYYQARQRGRSGPWHFTRENRRTGTVLVDCTEDCRHASAEEACQHWVEAEVAKGVKQSSCSWALCDAGDCDNPAPTLFSIGGLNGSAFALCAEHASEAKAIEMFRERHQGSFELASSF